jgi:peroxiredoxin
MRYTLSTHYSVLSTLLLCGSVTAADLGRVKEFTLNDPKGVGHTKKEWEGKRAIVLFFLGTECPVSNGYSPEYRRLVNTYASRGVLFIGVHPDPEVKAEDVVKHATEYALTFPLLLDPTHLLTSQTGIRVTPECVVLIPDGTILYRGRIDDKYSADGRRRDEAKTKDLEEALKSVLEAKIPAVRETKAFGCPLPPPRKK